MSLYLVEGLSHVFIPEGDDLRFLHEDIFKYIIEADGTEDARSKVLAAFREKDAIGKFQYRNIQMTVWPSIND